MLRKIYGGFVIVLLWASICSAAVAAAAATTSTVTANEEQQTNDSNNAAAPGLRSIMRIYDECQRSDSGVAMCLKKKAVTFIDRISKIDVINVGDGIRVVGVENAAATAKSARALNEYDLDQMMPRSMEDRDYFLNNMLTDKLANYISGRKIQISLPQVTPNELGRGMEEGEQIETNTHLILFPNFNSVFNRNRRK